MPSYQEFETLINVADPDFGIASGYRYSTTAGKFLKSAQGWKDYNGASGNGNDSYGFSALPAGYRYYDGDFNISHEASEAAKHAWPFLSRSGKRLRHAGLNAFFWSSSEGRSRSAYYMDLYYSDEGANLRNDTKNFGFSVRCLQNN